MTDTNLLEEILTLYKDCFEHPDKEKITLIRSKYLEYTRAHTYEENKQLEELMTKETAIRKHKGNSALKRK